MHLLLKGLYPTHICQQLHYTWQGYGIIDAVISSLKGGNENFDLVDQGRIDKNLGLLS
jgi:hypothetical protein